MRILTDQKVKFLFIQIVLCMLAFVLAFTAAAALRWNGALFLTPICFFSMGAFIFLFCYRFFKEQDRVLEDAAMQIREYIAGDRNARIECNEEGELYRLFHEVNSLVAILNAHAETERRTRKFLKNTISDISHQLKTPLAALNIYNGIIQSEAEEKDAETIEEFCVLSGQELDRIETLVQNLLKITKFDAGAIIMEKHPENISEMMADVKKYFAYCAECEGKEIILSGSDSLFLLCDKNWMMEAVSNIVKNALDHTENGDDIRITWKESASAVRIMIEDNGKGIHPEDLPHIFKRFYRSRHSKDKQGIGLGLPLAKSVVEAHGGTLTCNSRLGAGTAFIVNFLVS